MNRLFKNKFKVTILSIVALIIFTGPILTYLSLQYGEMNTIDFMVSITSISIAFIALIVALSTYFSIDSVNNLTKMEGNVLENEDYTISIAEIVNKYDQKTAEEAADAVFTDLETKFSKKNSNTAVKVAKNLQSFIDVIIIFPSLFDTKNRYHEKNMERMKRLLDQMDNRIDNLLSVSVGNLTLIEETQKLIKAIVYYQKFAKTKDLKPAADLLEVKGSIVKNSVTRTVYYNYLGLFCLKKVFSELQYELDLEDYNLNEISTIEIIVGKRNELNDRSIELLSIYLAEAEESFKQALKNSNNDFIWQAFVTYNQARVLFWKQLLLNSDDEKAWVTSMDKAIYARKRLNLFSDDILEGEDTYIKGHFKYQEYLANLVKFNYCIATKRDVFDHQKNTTYEYPEYNGLLENEYIQNDFTENFSKIAEYQNQIRERLNSNLV